MSRHQCLVSAPEKCTGCETCVDVCVLRNNGFVDPSLSRIWISRKEAEGSFLPFICHQCEPAPCEKSCPVGAIAKNDPKQAYVIDRELCIGCEACMPSCPFNVIRIDQEGKAIKCEYCNGDPACVKACQPGALIWSDVIRPDKIIDHELSEMRAEHVQSIQRQSDASDGI